MGNTTPSARELNEIRAKCHSTLNWTDGGHWMGDGPEPSCFSNRETRNQWQLISQFPSDPAARAWNTEWEKAIRMAGHGGGAAIAAAVYLLTSGWAGVAAGTLASIFQSELQARINWPRMSRGWSYSVTFAHTYHQSTFGGSRFEQVVTGESRNHRGLREWHNVSRTSFEIAGEGGLQSGLPDSVARQIVSSPSWTRTVVYGQAAGR